LNVTRRIYIIERNSLHGINDNETASTNLASFKLVALTGICPACVSPEKLRWWFVWWHILLHVRFGNSLVYRFYRTHNSPQNIWGYPNKGTSTKNL